MGLQFQWGLQDTSVKKMKNNFYPLCSDAVRMLTFNFLSRVCMP